MKMLKILLCGLLLAMPVFANETDDRKTATSLKYVTNELDTRQNKLETGTNQAITYTNAAGGVQQRTVKSDLAGGSTSDTSLPTVSAVNTGLNQKQDEIDPINDHTAVTYTGQTGEISTKGIYQSDGTYADQTDSLIDAKTFNAALKNGLDSEFVCSDDRSPDDICWLWEIHSTDNGTLPVGYTPLEYIRSSGTQYIDTGIKGTNTTVSKIVFKINDLTAGGSIFGGLERNGLNYYGVGFTPTPQYRLWCGSGNYPWVLSGTPDLNKHELRLSNKILYIDNQQIAESNLSVSSDNTAKIFLFSTSLNDSVYHPSKINIYSARFWENNVLVSDFIPAKRDRDNVIGMYDLMDSNPATAFHTNQGSGSFSAGPAIRNIVYLPQGQ